MLYRRCACLALLIGSLHVANTSFCICGASVLWRTASHPSQGNIHTTMRHTVVTSLHNLLATEVPWLFNKGIRYITYMQVTSYMTRDDCTVYREPEGLEG